LTLIVLMFFIRNASLILPNIIIYLKNMSHYLLVVIKKFISSKTNTCTGQDIVRIFT